MDTKCLGLGLIASFSAFLQLAILTKNSMLRESNFAVVSR